MANLLKFKKKGLYIITTVIILVSVLSPFGFYLNNTQNNFSSKTESNLFSFNLGNSNLT